MVGKEKKPVPPDHLRCNRTDGRQWRCSRRSLDGKKLCEIHYLQGRHRQFKRKVPDSLKLERRIKIKKNKKRKLETGGSNSKPSRKSVGVDDHKKNWFSEKLDEYIKKMNLKRGDLQLELIRAVLKRQLGIRIDKRRKEIEKQNEIELHRKLVLPNAVMEISTRGIHNVEDEFEGKLGPSSSAFARRFFRSKNIESDPISTMQPKPKRKRKCHWCESNEKQSLTKCLTCRRKFFCLECIKERSLEKQEIITKCPVCRGECKCDTCLEEQPEPPVQPEQSEQPKQPEQPKTIIHKKSSLDKQKIEKIQLLQYLIYMLLPVLAQINQDQSIELEMETKDSDFLVLQAVTLNKKCNNCKISIVDYHRTCVKCSYNLCLNCCWEFRDRGNLSNTSNTKTSSEQLNLNSPDSRPMRMPVLFTNLEIDGKISCPPVKFGGCGETFLQLRSIFPFKFTKDLEVKAAEMLSNYNFPKPLNDSSSSSSSSSCVLCKEKVREVSTRKESGDNLLYCPNLQDLNPVNFKHFHQHWSKGEPVIVRGVVSDSLDLKWDPVSLLCDYLEMRNSSPSKSVVGTNCSDWCEIEIANKQRFIGSIEGETYANMRRKTITIKTGLSSDLFQEYFPAHYSQILRNLPLQDFINPNSGLLNLAVKLPQEVTQAKPELGPGLYITYGGPDELTQPEFLTKLCYESCDMVNILAYATDEQISEENLEKIRDLMRKFKGQDCNKQSTSTITDQKDECGLKYKGFNLVNGFSKVPFNLDESIKNRMFNENMIYDSDEHTESDYEDSMLYYGTSDESEGWEDLESCLENQDVDTCGAQWDIWRRQDVSKLMEYLNRYSNDFNCSKHVVHPILDQVIYIDAFHKRRLKEEFDIEAWTFEQHPGEAVIIPAGCPYQIKKLKSCVNICLDFISPESVNECINLSDEIRQLSVRHKAKEKVLEVKKMVLHGINDAVEEIRDYLHTETIDDDDDELTEDDERIS